MLVHRFDRILARTDPFDLAQSLERCVRAMSADRIRSLVIDARDRMGDYYRAEFLRLLSENGGESRVAANKANIDQFVEVVRNTSSARVLQDALIRLLKSNLRAIPIFGAAFSEAVLEHVPNDRAIALGEEESAHAGLRTAVFGGIAVALVIAGAVGEHFITNVRAQTSASPVPLSAAVPVASPQPPPAVLTPHPPLVAPQTAATRKATPTARPEPPRLVSAAPAAPITPEPVPVEATRAPVQARYWFVRHPRPARKPETPPPAAGIATIQIPTPAPTPEPSDLDTSDMPDSYTDATPLPAETAPPAAAPSSVRLSTPTPKPRPRGWLNRNLRHLDPFKPHRP